MKFYKSSTWVIASFIIVVILIVGVGLVAIFQLRQINKNVDQLTNNLAEEKTVSDEIIRQVLLTRFYAHRFIRTSDQVDVDRFIAEYQILEDLLLRAESDVTDPDRMEMVDTIKTAVAAYGDSFQRVVAIVRAIQNTHSEVLDAQDVFIMGKMKALRVHAITRNDPGIFLAFDNAQYAYQRMELYSLAYTSEENESYVVQFETAYQNFLLALESMEADIQDTRQLQNITDIKKASEIYVQGFQDIHAHIHELKTIFETDFDTLEPQIVQTAIGMTQQIDREFQTKNAYSHSLIDRTRFVLIAITFLGILTGLVLGLQVIRRTNESIEAEMALRIYQAQLEEVVEVRTSDLKAANSQLVDEINERKQIESDLEETVSELQRTNAQIQGFNRIAVGREHRMIELKNEINQLCNQLDLEPRYDTSFAENDEA